MGQRDADSRMLLEALFLDLLDLLLVVLRAEVFEIIVMDRMLADPAIRRPARRGRVRENMRLVCAAENIRQDDWNIPV